MTQPEWDTQILHTPNSSSSTQGTDPADASPSPPQSRVALPHRWMGVWVLGTLLALGVGYLAGFLVRTPLDQAQENSHVVIQATATATMHDFVPDIASGTGTIRKGRTITLPEFALPNGDTPIVTERIAKAGTTIASGRPVLSIAGHPVFVLSIPFPLYRDLAPGDSGHDVKALQQELARLGHYHGAIDGDYGPGMAAAVRELYRSSGATPPSASADLLDAVTAAQQELNAATSERPTPPSGDSTTTEDGTNTVHTERPQAALTTALAAAKRAADTPLPRFAIIAIPAKSVDVIKTPPVGTQLSESPDSLHLRSQGTTVTGRLSVLEAEGFTEGDTVTVTVQTNTHVHAEGTLTNLSEFKEGEPDNNIPPGYDYVVTVPADNATEFSDNDGVTITASHTTTTATTALAVPLLAIRQDSNGTYVLTVTHPRDAANPDDHTRINVTPGQQQDGWVDITGADLNDGDIVVLGGGQ